MLAILVDIRLFVLCINYESLLIYPFQLGANKKEALASFLVVGCKLKHIFVCFD